MVNGFTTVYYRKCVNKKFIQNVICDDCLVINSSSKQSASDTKSTLSLNENNGDSILAEINKKINGDL